MLPHEFSEFISLHFTLPSSINWGFAVQLIVSNHDYHSLKGTPFFGIHPTFAQ